MIGMLALLVIYTAVLVKHASYAVGGSDSSGYANLARSLLQARVVLPIPELDQFGFPTENAPLFVPLGYIQHREGNTPTRQMSPIYPVGFSLHLAIGALIFGWKVGPFLVSPLLGALSLVLIYLVGLQLGLTRAYAFAGALILAANPTFIFMALQPMSDVTALCWALALIWAGLHSRQNDKWALLAGAAFGAGFLVRPTNCLMLAPLAFCLRLKPKTILLFVLGGLPLAIFFSAYNFIVFGGLLQTGYSLTQHQDLIVFAGLSTRLKHYLFWLTVTLSPLLLLGWAGVGLVRRLAWRDRALLSAWFGAFFIFYLFYSFYDAWWYTRFLLPGYPALILGALLTTEHLLANLLDKRRQLAWAVGLALLLVAVGCAWQYDRKLQALRVGREQANNAESCRWADARLPTQAMVVAGGMSGALKFYTKRPILRWESLPLEVWPSVKNRVQERGCQFYALLLPYEIEEAQRRARGIWRAQGHWGNISLWQIEPTDKALPAIQYVRGFYDSEGDEQGHPQRWMSDEGVARLENTGRQMRLQIEGDIPLNVLPKSSTIKLIFNGAVLEQMKAQEPNLQREFIITPAQQGAGKWSELQISTDQVFVPHQLNPRNEDGRRLGFLLTRLGWEEK